MRIMLTAITHQDNSRLGRSRACTLFSKFRCQKVAAFLLALGFSLLGSTGGHGATGSDPLPAELDYEVLLNHITDSLIEIRDTIDRSTFDLSALIDRLEYQSSEIISFVQSEIHFQAYPGVLRGARGTLMSRSGNALDQSLLTATLLKDAGFEARIVRAELTQEQARMLLSRIANSKPRTLNDAEKQAIVNFAASLEGIKPDFDKSLDRFVRDLQHPTALQESEMYQQMNATSEALISRLSGRQQLLRRSELTAELVDDITDYFWVELKTDAASGWQGVHPVFEIVPESFQDLEKLETYKDSIPPALHQTVEFSVTILQKVGAKLVEHQIVGPWSRPVANLFGRPFTFSNVPDWQLHLSEETIDAGKIGQGELFFPLFNGQVAPGGLAFDLKGRVVPMDAAGSHMAGIFKQVGDTTLKATDALSQLGEASDQTQTPAMQLIGQYLTIRTRLPDGTSQVYRRAVTPESLTGEPIRDETNPDEEMRKGLMQSYTIMIGPGQYPDNYIVDRYLERLLRVLTAFSTFEKTKNPNVAFKDVPRYWPGTHTFLASQSSLDLDEEAALSYIWRPVVALHADYLSEEGELSSRVDILSNARRVFKVEGSKAVTAPYEALKLGVWDTLLESRVIGGKGQNKSLGTMNVMASAHEKGIELRVMLPEDIASLDAMPLSGLAKKYLRRDLTAGYAVVVPALMPYGQEDETGWWRIHTGSGESLGMLSNGGGVQLTEQQIVDIVSGVAVAGACLAALYVYGKMINADALTYAAGIVTCVGLGLLFVADVPAAISYGLGVLGAIIMFVQFEVQRQSDNP